MNTNLHRCQTCQKTLFPIYIGAKLVRRHYFQSTELPNLSEDIISNLQGCQTCQKKIYIICKCPCLTAHIENHVYIMKTCSAILRFLVFVFACRSVVSCSCFTCSNCEPCIASYKLSWIYTPDPVTCYAG